MFFRDGEDDFVPKTVQTDTQLIHGDAFQALPRMEEGEVDVLISDPPYSTQTHEGARTTTSSSSKDRNGKKALNSTELLTFDSIAPEEFVIFAKLAVRAAKRWVVTFCDWKFAHLLEEVGLVRLGCWTKPNAMPQLTGDRPATGWEAIAILHRPGKKHWNGSGKAAVWNYNKVNAVHHPTEKPLNLLKELVKLFSDPGEVVCDPFMGSGGVGVACAMLGRRFVGVEKDESYFKVAQKRLARRR